MKMMTQVDSMMPNCHPSMLIILIRARTIPLIDNMAMMLM